MSIPDNSIKVLQNGYVRLVDSLGSDLSVTNAARASFAKESNEFSDKDDRLLKFLWREQHTSPFRHAALTFEIKAPLFCARQIWKHAVGSTHTEDQQGWNENSFRYLTSAREFYVPEPDGWRTAPENKKQGSAEPLPHFISLDESPKDGSKKYGNYWTRELQKTVDEGVAKYNDAMEAGVAPEIARLFLPAYGLLINWRWTTSLAAVMHFLQQRLAHDTQYETTEYAKAVYELTKTVFPQCMELINET